MGEQVSERESLTEAIKAAWDDAVDAYWKNPMGTRQTITSTLAVAALAWFAEHRGPRVVSTVEELDALPVGSVVLDNFGYSWQRSVNGLWMNGESIFSSADLMTDEDSGEVPATVLFAPTTESEDR